MSVTDMNFCFLLLKCLYIFLNHCLGLFFYMIAYFRVITKFTHSLNKKN